jgi:hypothetical protein
MSQHNIQDCARAQHRKVLWFFHSQEHPSVHCCTTACIPQYGGNAAASRPLLPNQCSLTVQYENGSHSTARLHGRSVEIDVAVAPTVVQFVGTFVTKTTQQYFHVINRTAQPTKFALRRFASPAEAGQEHEVLADGATSSECSWKPSQLDIFGTRAMSAFPMDAIVYPGTQMEVCSCKGVLCQCCFMHTLL